MKIRWNGRSVGLKGLKGRTFHWSLGSSRGTASPSGLMKILVESIPGPKGAEWPWLGERLALWVLGPQIMAEPTGWPRERCMRSHQEFRAFRKASRPGQPAAIGTASPGTPKQWHIHVASNGKAVPSSHYCDQSGRRRSAQARFHRDKLEGADRTGRGQKARSASTYFFAIHFRSTHNPHRVHLGGNGRLHYAIDWVAGSGAKRMAP